MIDRFLPALTEEQRDREVKSGSYPTGLEERAKVLLLEGYSRRKAIAKLKEEFNGIAPSHTTLSDWFHELERDVLATDIIANAYNIVQASDAELLLRLQQHPASLTTQDLSIISKIFRDAINARHRLFLGAVNTSLKQAQVKVEEEKAKSLEDLVTMLRSHVPTLTLDSSPPKQR